MDTDFLADVIPPRYAVESDEEDEENPLLPPAAQANRVVDVKIAGDYPTEKPMLLAIGLAAQTWAKGVGLGEVKASIVLNGIQVGFAFSPSWMKATVVVSEATIRIPTWAMYGYAEAVIAALKPTSIVILDTYSAPQYIDAHPISAADAPIRYLSTDARSPVGRGASPFAPPNVLQATSAAFMLISALSSSAATLLLLPSPYSMLPPASELSSLGLSREIDWPTATMAAAHQWLLQALGEQASSKWDRNSSRTSARAPWLTLKRDEPPPDSGMYL